MKIIDFILSNKEYFENYISRSTYHTNAIEGSTLTYAETYALLFNDNSFQVKAEPREIYEAINHKDALSYMLKHIEEPLSKTFVVSLAKKINQNINEISGYRTVSVFIRGAEHIPPEPNEIDQKMMYFFFNYDRTQYNSVFDKIAYNHIEFERIHPFADGNGRTGRLLINYELLRNDLPPAIIPKDRRTEYFDLLANKDALRLSDFVKELSQKEKEVLQTFGFEKFEKRKPQKEEEFER